MWPLFVVVGLPFRDQPAGVQERTGQCLIQKLVAKSAIQALDKRVLHPLARFARATQKRRLFTGADDLGTTPGMQGTVGRWSQ